VSLERLIFLCIGEGRPSESLGSRCILSTSRYSDFNHQNYIENEFHPDTNRARGGGALHLPAFAGMPFSNMCQRLWEHVCRNFGSFLGCFRIRRNPINEFLMDKVQKLEWPTQLEWPTLRVIVTTQKNWPASDGHCFGRRHYDSYSRIHRVYTYRATDIDMTQT